jgi:hypothetical protein
MLFFLREGLIYELAYPSLWRNMKKDFKAPQDIGQTLHSWVSWLSINKKLKQFAIEKLKELDGLYP